MHVKVFSEKSRFIECCMDNIPLQKAEIYCEYYI